MNDFDITDIEVAVSDTIRQIGVSKNVFRNRPSSSVKDLPDFVVVSVAGGVSDKFAFGQCRVSVHLFAKDVQNHKNDKKLSVMYKKFTDAFPASIGGRYLFDLSEVRLVGDTDDRNGYHVRIIQLNKVIIKIS